MGFGYLFLGYLTAFLLEITVNAIHAGPLALLVGYSLMAVGVWRLKAYQRSFRLALPPLALLFLVNIYRILEMFGEWFLWNPAWMSDSLGTVAGWLEFVFILLFHSLLLPAVLRLAMAVGLPKTAVAASRNLILVWIWAALYLVVRLAPLSSDAGKVFGVVLTLFDFLFIILNLFLFLSCMKNIAPANEDDSPRRYRWNLLNRIGDRFAREQERASETKRGETEAYLRRRKEKQEQKKKRGK